jgi:NAD(P)-dependent dehydrogenase (short-subunit alcohol dehydrogenase family)
MQLDGATAVVTGGASGLGAATAAALAAGGAEVFALDLPGARERADASVATFVECDVTQPDQVEAAIAQAAAGGTLRICVNCAGVGLAERTVARDGSPAALEPFRRTIEVNLLGTFDVIRNAAAAISATEPREGERGVIVNTASVAAFDGQIGQAAYSASKGGIVGMTLPIARDLAVSLIRCVTIAPGLFDTPLLATLPEAAREALGASIPHPARLGRPEEYAALVRHIVENPMLNGEVIRLDGAIRMAPK